MKHYFLTGCIAAALALTACSKNKNDTPEATACIQPATADSIRENLQKIIADSAQAFAGSDSRGYVDADKVIAAATRLQVTLGEPQSSAGTAKTSSCSSRVDITVPAEVWTVAQTNYPLLFTANSFADFVGRLLTGSSITSADNVFTTTLRYPATAISAASAPASASAPAVAPVPDVAIQNIGMILGNVLLPYGIKDTLIINGKAYSRADALAMAVNPQAAAETLSPEAQAASAILNGGAASDVAPTPAEPAVSDDDVQRARTDSQSAQIRADRAWAALSNAVRNELTGEQQQWAAKKADSCRAAAAKATSAAESEYRRLRCEARMNGERAGYLRGFSIN